MSKLAVWKFPATRDDDVEDQFSIDMPRGAEILAVQMQHGKPCIWALCDTEAKKEPRNFVWVGTGHEYPARFYQGLSYVGTIQQAGGNLVFHLFEETRGQS